MINPVDYMSRLKMPAMMTDTEGGVIFANAAADAEMPQKTVFVACRNFRRKAG